MASIEQTFIDNSPLTPLFYVWIIGDIFMIWTHGSEDLEQFTTSANSTHPSIKFATEISSTSLPFLDVLLCVKETGTKTSLYRKPTDRPTYLMYCSFQPHHIKSSIVSCQLLGLKRICSDIYDYEHGVRILSQSLLSWGYPYILISEQINYASHIVRTKSLTSISNKNTNEKRITFYAQFHLSIATFLKNANKDWLKIRTNNRFNIKLSNPIILANKQPRNLQQLHSSSRNTYLQCSQPYHKPRCKVLSHIDIRCSNKFYNNVTISAAKAVCDSQNVVYILFCAMCPNAVYVGETSDRFRFRLSNHKQSTEHNFSGYPVAMHFNEQSYTIQDLRCIIIENHVPNMDNRKLIDEKTIIKLKTHITGLNKDRHFYSHHNLLVACTWLLNARPN